MACGCKNKTAGTSVKNNVVKSAPTSSTQEAKPVKTTKGNRIIRREIR